MQHAQQHYTIRIHERFVKDEYVSNTDSHNWTLGTLGTFIQSKLGYKDTFTGLDSCKGPTAAVLILVLKYMATYK